MSRNPAIRPSGMGGMRMRHRRKSCGALGLPSVLYGCEASPRAGGIWVFAHKIVANLALLHDDWCTKISTRSGDATSHNHDQTQIGSPQHNNRREDGSGTVEPPPPRCCQLSNQLRTTAGQRIPTGI